MKLTRKELTFFKQLLLKEKEKLLQGITHIERETLSQSQRDASGDLSGYTYHMADVATDNFDREFSLHLASAEQRILYEIDEALKRIADHSYGVCEECGKQIPKVRLKIVPYARCCIQCQAKQEPRRKTSA